MCDIVFQWDKVKDIMLDKIKNYKNWYGAVNAIIKCTLQN